MMPSHPHKGKYSFVQGPSFIKLSSIQVISLLQEMKKNDINIKNIVIFDLFMLKYFNNSFKIFKKNKCLNIIY